MKLLTHKVLVLASLVMTIIGFALFIHGCTVKIPNEKLSHHIYDENNASIIQEYVGGDAYNYIIGAAIAGNKIAAAKTEKAVYICTGLWMTALGGAVFAYECAYVISRQNKKKNEGPEPKTSDVSADNP